MPTTSQNINAALSQPLAARMRPQSIDDFFGQSHLLSPGRPLRRLIESKTLHSMILWGPPGSGKTTLAKLLAKNIDANVENISAVLAGVKELRVIIERANQTRALYNRDTVLFVDEVHRFNKSQQDAFLPHVENGTLILIGATTENPSFELNNALLSRTRVYVLRRLQDIEIVQILDAALHNKQRRPFTSYSFNEGYDQNTGAQIRKHQIDKNQVDESPINESLINANNANENSIIISDELKLKIAQAADGDARRALNLLEICIDFAEETDFAEEADLAEENIEKGIKKNVEENIEESTEEKIENKKITTNNKITQTPSRYRYITAKIVHEVLTDGVRRFDKQGEMFYDQISALHKAVRGSSPDAALYWLARMIDGGCDIEYLARRMLRCASEDIGNADPRALTLVLDAWQTYDRMGSPEGELALAQAIIYLAVAPKSNATYTAFSAAMDDVKKYGSLEVPLHLRNAPTKLMKELDYGKHYRYAHDEENAYAAGENYFPDDMPQAKEKRYYYPVMRGLEQKIAEKLEQLRKLDKERK